MRAWLAAAIAAPCLLGALPATAGATDYCVFPNVGCGGTNTTTLEKALDYADNANDPDRIFLGAFTYVAPTTGGFDYSQSGGPVEIVGKGAGQTVLTAPSGASSVLRLFGGAGSSAHDLRISIPANVANGFAGLSTDDTARRIDVIEAKQQLYDRQGVHLENGGVLEDSNITLGPLPTPSATGVWTDAGGGTVRRSSISALYGVVARYGGTIERTRFVTSGAGVVGGNNVTTVRSSSIFVAGQPAVGLYANPLPGSSGTVNADGVTIIGAGRLSTRAVTANTFAAPAENATVNITNSIIRDGRLEAATPASGTGHASIAISYSDHEPDSDESNGPYASIARAHMTNVGDAKFADPTLGDFHLLPGSPLIDAGNPATGQGLDLDGNPLVRDGNGDGTPRRDMGALEFQSGATLGDAPPPAGGAGGAGGGTPVDTQAPLIESFRTTRSLFALARAATPVAARVPRGTRFVYALSEPAAIALKLQRALPGRRSGGRCVRPSSRLRKAKRCVRHATVGTLRRNGAKGLNRIRFTGRIGKHALRPGGYRAVISATDAASNRSAPRRAVFRVAVS